MKHNLAQMGFFIILKNYTFQNTCNYHVYFTETVHKGVKQKSQLHSELFFQPNDTNFHGQEQVYGDLGEEMLEHAFEGKGVFIPLQSFDCILISDFSLLQFCEKFSTYVAK